MGARGSKRVKCMATMESACSSIIVEVVITMLLFLLVDARQ